MNVGEAHQHLQEFQEDLVAFDPTDRERIWYEEEMAQQPEHQEAVLANQLLETLGSQLISLSTRRNRKNAQKPEMDYTESASTHEVHTERPLPKFSPETDPRARTAYRINGYLNEYDSRMESASHVGKSSKRQKQEQLALRDFIKNFATDSQRDEHKGKHVVHDPDTLNYSLAYLYDNGKDELANELLEASCDYATKNAEEIMGDAVGFSRIIARAAEDECGAEFDEIITSLFREMGTTKSASIAYKSVHHAMLELADSPRSLTKAMGIFSTEAKLLSNPHAFATDLHIEWYKALLNDDLQTMAEDYSMHSIRTALKYAHPDFDLDANSVIFGNNKFVNRTRIRNSFTAEEYQTAREKNTKFMEDLNILLFDVLIDELDQGRLTISEPSVSKEFMDVLTACSMFQKYRKLLLEHELNEYSVYYTTEHVNEKSIDDNKPRAGSTLISPAKILKYSFYDTPIATGAALLEGVEKTIETYAADVNNPDFIHIESNGRFPIVENARLLAHQLNAGNTQEQGVQGILDRPPTFIDKDSLYTGEIKKLILPIAQLGIVNNEQTLDEVATRSETVKAEIKAQQHQFLGRRPIRFTFPDLWRAKSGLQSVELRKDESKHYTHAAFNHDEGVVHLFLDHNLSIVDTSNGKPVAQLGDLNMNAIVAAELTVATLLKEWACRSSVETSEGTLNGERSTKVNIGHFAYLGLKSDGQPKKFSEEQADAYLEEQPDAPCNLATVSERRKAADPTGQNRNSTYVRERYNPNDPALEIYFDKTVLDINS